MHEHAGFRNPVDVLSLHFEVVDGLRRSARDAVGQPDRAVQCVEPFTRPQLIGTHKLMAIFRPEGMICGRTDWIFFAFDAEVENLGGRMLERAGHHAAASFGDGRAVADDQDRDTKKGSGVFSEKSG